ncbi:MAG: hypothetical protein IT324_19310, partial [Anaerolineae bacterium]|nr:hypothetical protein [Anaerolineae bacterium]
MFSEPRAVYSHPVQYSTSPFDFLGWDVVQARTYAVMQAMLDRSPQAQRYFSDDFSTYETLVYYPG